MATPYVDNGDSEHVCEHCGAMFWFAERLLSTPRTQRYKYNQCCSVGNVCIPLPMRPPSTIQQLFDDASPMGHIRAYKNMFAMTSFRAEIDETINDGRGPYVFKISGQLSHWIGSLCPPASQKPRFLQMYVYDTENEISNRLRFFGGSENSSLSEDIVRAVSETLTNCNEYVRLFKTTSEMRASSGVVDYQIRLYNNIRDTRYNPPAPRTLGCIVCQTDPNASSYDVIVHSKYGIPKRVSKLHPSYMPLQYPLLFPFAKQGWSPDFCTRSTSSREEKKVSINMYYRYQLHDRAHVYSLLLHGGKLFQQYLVDAYRCIEQDRLDYISSNQDMFRSEYISGIYDAIGRGESSGCDIGRRVILPSSFTGGPRYMYKNYQDALALCRVYGTPQYFITFTCNTNWPEISRHLSKVGCHHSRDRPDITSRVFQMKVENFLKFLHSDKPFGDVAAGLYTIEFQKRSLPHYHTLLWVTTNSKIREPSDVDRYISAEIPDENIDPFLYKTVTESMIHEPCGLANPNSTCTQDGKCSKHFPRGLIKKDMCTIEDVIKTGI